MMNKLLLAIVLFCICCPLWALDFSAAIDRSRLSENETVELTLTLQGALAPSQEQPDLSSVQSDFKIIGVMTSRQHRSINGKVQQITQWKVTLMPRRRGHVRIPSITYQQFKTAPISLQVTAPESAPQRTAEHRSVFLKVETEPENLSLGGQLLYTLRIYYAENVQDASLATPRADNAEVEQYGQASNHEAMLEGQQYVVTEMKFIITPMQAGPLRIIGPELKGRILASMHPTFTQFMGYQAQGFSEKAPDITVQVQPLVQGHEDAIVARGLRLYETWSKDPSSLKVGEPVTRKIAIEADGVTGKHLPEIPLPEVDKLNQYKEKGATSTSMVEGHLHGRREIKYVYIPTAEGPLNLPKVSLSWWDSKARNFKTATLPERALTILPASRAREKEATSAPLREKIAPPVQAHESPTTDHWFWLALAMAGLWCLTLGIWLVLRFRHRLARHASDSSKQQIKKACLRQDPHGAAKALLVWSKQRWPNELILDLGDLREKTHDAVLKAALGQLSDVIYQKNSAPWDGARFWQLLQSLFQEKPTLVKKTASPLPEIY